MSSSKLRRLSAILFLGSALGLAGCQVTPLYAERPAGEVALTEAIYIEEVDDRVAQQLRNELIFLFNGGQRQPDNPRFSMTLETEQRMIAILRDSNTGEATGQNLQVLARYRLTDIRTGEQVFVHAQRVTTTFDRFEQGFADIRAERDAQNRAARELAERIQADLAIALE